MKIDLKNQKGITLIVLVITIIVMIILASIGINYGLNSVDTAQDSVVEANLHMIQQKIEEDYIKNDMNGEKNNFYGQALTFDDVENIKGSETISLQKLTNKTEYEKGKPYYKLSTEILENMGLHVPNGQVYIVDYETGEIWDVTNSKYNDGETYAYLGPINSLESDAEKNVDSPISISIEEDLTLDGDAYCFKVRVKDKSAKIASSSWISEDITAGRTIIQNQYGRVVDAGSLFAFAQSEITSADDVEGEYVYTIRFSKAAFYVSGNDSQEITIIINRDSIIDNNGNTNSKTILNTSYIPDIAEGDIEWELRVDNYSSDNEVWPHGYWDNINKVTWGQDATVRVTIHASTGLKNMPYIFKYYWSPDGSAPTDFDSVASDIVITPDEGDFSSASTIYLNGGTGKGKLYVKPKESYTGINSQGLEMGYKTADVCLDNTPPRMEEKPLDNAEFWGLYNPDYFRPGDGTIIDTENIYKLRIIDDEAGIKEMSNGETLSTLDGVNKTDFGSDILKNDNKLLEFFENDFRMGGTLFYGVPEQLAQHPNYIDIDDTFLFGDRASDYYYIYKLKCMVDRDDENSVISDNVGNKIELPLKQGPFNIDALQPDIDDVYIDQRDIVGKIKMIDDYSGVVSGKAEDAQKNIDNLKNVKYKWVPENDYMLTQTTESLVRLYRSDPARAERELTTINTDSDHIVYSQENDFGNYKYATVTVDPPTAPGKYYLFVYAPDFEDVAGNILVDYFTVSESGGSSSASWFSHNVNKGADGARFSSEPIVIESDATDVRIQVTEQNNVGFPTSFSVKVYSPSNKKFEIKKLYIERSIEVTANGIYDYNSERDVYKKTENLLTTNVQVNGSYVQTWYSTMNGPIKIYVEDKYGNVYSEEFTLQHVQETIWEMSVQAGKKYTLPKGRESHYRYVQIGNNPGIYQKAEEYSFIAPRTEKIKVRISGPRAIYGFDNGSKLENEVLNTALAITKVERFGIHSDINTSGGFSSNSMQKLYNGCKNLSELPSLEGDDLAINQNAFAYVIDSLNYTFRGTAISNFDSRFLRKADKIIDFVGTFEECKNLKSVSGDLFAYCALDPDKEASFECTFKQSGLEEIPENLFNHNPQKGVLSFEDTFYETNVTEIPEKLFANCGEAKTFEGTFEKCRNIREIPEKLFEKNEKATTFTSTFKETSVESVSVKLFEKNTKVTTFAYTFHDARLKSIPERLFEKNTKAITFQSTFWGNNITSIPEKLFEKNVEATVFIAVFQKNQITSIPVNIFVKNVKGTLFGWAFAENPITSIPERLFEKNVVATHFNNTFQSTKITSIPEKLFYWNPEATSFNGTFKLCGDLVNTSANQNIPYNLFYKNPKVTDFGALFMDDGKIEWIPENFFEKQKNQGYTIRFSDTFRATSLHKVPKELFWYLKPSTFSNCFGYSAVEDFKAEYLEKTDLSELEAVNRMFICCKSLTSVSGDVFKNAHKLTTADRMFEECENLPKMDATIFKGCESLHDVGAMFYRCTNLTSVTEKLFEYQSGKYCPIDTISIHVDWGNPAYGDSNKPHNDKECYADVDGIFEKCTSLTKCPDIWNKTKYPNIVIKTRISDTCRVNNRLTEPHTVYENYEAFYEANSVVKNKITDSDLRYKWCNTNFRVYFNYAE